MLTVMMLLIVASLIGLNSARSAMMELTMAQAFHKSANQLQEMESALKYVQRHTISGIDLVGEIAPDWQAGYPSWNISLPYDSQHNVLVEYIGIRELEPDPEIPAQQEQLFRLTAFQVDTESTRGTRLSAVVARIGTSVRQLSWKRIE